MKAEWSIRAYTEGDEEKIFDLTRAAFPEREFDLKHWLKLQRWMYKENPAGAAKIWLAEHDGRIVGHSAAMLVAIKVGTEVITGFQSTDTMTHPDYQGQGIYQTLAKQVYVELEREGIYVGYRFPNKFSHPIAVKKLSWFDVAMMRNMFKVLNWGNALKARTSSKFLLKLGAIAGSILQGVFYRTERAPIVENLVISQIFSFDERINRFWNRISNQYKMMVVRDRDYLNWRYIDTPDTKYLIYIAEMAGEIYGFIVLRSRLEGGVKVSVICDLLAQSQNVAHCLVAKAIERCQEEKTDIIYCSFVADKPYVTALRRNGFMFTPLIRDRYFCAYSSSPYISKKLLMERQNWFVQTGDSDQI